MKRLKGSIRTTLILTILTISGVLIPMMANASVRPDFVDFGEVVIGSSSTRTLSLTNTNTVQIDISLFISGDECGFSVNPSSLSLEPNIRGFVDVSFAPREAVSCSASLIVEITGSQQRVLLVGIGILPPPPPPPLPPRTIMIGGFDTGIGDSQYEGQLISEWIEECAREAKNHGTFVRCVAHLTNELKRAGIITEEEKDIIQGCAARARIPR